MNLVVYALVPKRRVKPTHVDDYAIDILTEKMKKGIVTVAGTKKEFREFQLSKYNCEMYRMLNRLMWKYYSCKMSNIADDLRKLVSARDYFDSDFKRLTGSLEIKWRIEYEVVHYIVHQHVHMIVLNPSVFHFLFHVIGHISNDAFVKFEECSYPCAYIKVDNVNSRLHKWDINKYYVTTLLLEIFDSEQGG